MRTVVIPPRGVRFTADSPWMALIDGLRASGQEIDGYGDTGRHVEALVVLNHQHGTMRLQSEHGIAPERTALVVLEPRVTAPMMYRDETLALYGVRFAASPIWARRIGGKSFYWPQDLQQPMARRGEADYVATLINADKRSAVRGSLYGLRRSVIRAFQRNSVPLAIFGPGWADGSTQRLIQATKAFTKASIARTRPDVREAFSDLRLRPTTWLGTVHAKADAFAVAEISIVIENSSDYVSEKLIDAVCAGVVPLYVGPPLDHFGIPNSLAIQCGPSAEEVLAALLQVTPTRRSEIVAAGREWLMSAESHNHESQVVLRELGRQIGQEINQRR